MSTHKCRKCGKDYERKLETRSDADVCPFCGWAHWDPTGELNKNWKPSS